VYIPIYEPTEHGCSRMESGFDWLFLLVDGLSAVDIIALFASAALGVAASCTHLWPLQSSSSCCTAKWASAAAHWSRTMDHWSLLPEMHCNRIGFARLCRMWGPIGHFRVRLSVACDWCGLGWACIDGSV